MNERTKKRVIWLHLDIMRVDTALPERLPDLPRDGISDEHVSRFKSHIRRVAHSRPDATASGSSCNYLLKTVHQGVNFLCGFEAAACP